MTRAIELKDVSKSFGQKQAVQSLDLSVPYGALYGFIGPNGAGKTTTIRMIMSILFPDRGEVSVLGRRSALEAKDRIGYLPEERGLYKKMRAGAFIEYVARLKGMPSSGLRRLVREWLERMGLGDVEKKRCEELSKGMQQKVQFIATLIHEPELLILDEPFSGLDPVNTRVLRELFLEQHDRGTTIIFSTHVMPQAEQICDHIVMIDDGRKVLDDSLASIRSSFDPGALLFEPLDPETDPGLISGLEPVREIQSDGTKWRIRLRADAEAQTVMRQIVERVPTSAISVDIPTLEDIFVQIAGPKETSA